MDPDPIFTELTATPTGAHDGHRHGARSVLDVIRAVEGAPPKAAEDAGVGLVPDVLTFSAT